MSRLHAFPMLVVCTILVAVPASAGDFAAMFGKHWGIAREFTLAVAEAMPAESYGFKPTPEQMTFGRLMTHIAAQNSEGCAVATGTTAVPEPQVRNKATAIRYLPRRSTRAPRHSPRCRRSGWTPKSTRSTGSRCSGRKRSVHVYAHGASSRAYGCLPAGEEHHAAGVAVLAAFPCLSRAPVGRGIPPGGVARRSNIPDMLAPHALPAGRRGRHPL